MKFEERLLNWLLGASMIFWSIMGIRENGFTPIRIGIGILNCTVGLLFIFRYKVKLTGNLKSILMSLPSFLIAGVCFRLTPLDTIWRMPPTLLFLFGILITLLSFIFLGKNFAILPALRNITQTGPYRIVRHPAYLGELIMVLACCWMINEWWAGLLFIALIGMLQLRIKAEEQVLTTNEQYKLYHQKVKWRLIPYVW